MLKAEPDTFKICSPSAHCSFTTNGTLISGTTFFFPHDAHLKEAAQKLGVSKSKMCAWVGVLFFEMPAQVGALLHALLFYLEQVFHLTLLESL